MSVVVDQRDVQKRGGLCAKYPSSYVVCEMLRKHSIRRVLDVTFGRGRFYALCRRDIELLIASDPVKWPWLVYPDRFYQATAWQLYNLLKNNKVQVREVDCVVVDPPRWSRGAEYRRRGEYNFLIGSPRLIIEYAAKAAALINAKHILLHYNKVVEVENYTPVHVVEFRWLARYLNTENKNTSYYIIYKHSWV